MTKFGEQRLLRTSRAERLLFRFMGVADPAHYLHSLYLRRALDSLDNFHPTRVLDAGCGAGDYSFYLARRYPNAQVIGVDLDETLIQRGRETAPRLGISNVEFRVADLASLDLNSEVDFLIAIDVLEHIAQQKEAIQCLAGSLRPGGYAFFHLPTVRERPVPFSRWLTGFHAWAEKEHVAELGSAGDFEAAVRAANLDVVQSRRTFGYFTGELATSLFVLPYANTPLNRLCGALLAPGCRVLAWCDALNLERTRYAVCVLARRPGR